MTAYIIMYTEVFDAEAFRPYQQAVQKVVAEAGGIYLIRGGRREVLEGDVDPRRMVVLSFPSFEIASGFYHSPAYQEIKSLRKDVARFDAVLIDGFEGGFGLE